MDADDKDLKRGTIQLFFRTSFKKKRVDITTSTIDKSSQSQITEPDEVACCSTDKPIGSSSSSSLISSSSETFLLPSSSTSTNSPSTLLPSSSSISPNSPSTLLPPSSSSSMSPNSPSTLLPPPSSSISSNSSSTLLPPSSSSISPNSPSTLLISSLTTSPPSAMAAGTEISVIPLDISRSSKDSPSQPKLPSYKTNKENRSFHSQWYARFKWLEYSIERDSVFCYYCRHFGDTINVLNRNQSDAFVSGYNNWKNALTKSQGLPKHELSVSHRYAASNYEQFILRTSTQTSVIHVLDKGRAELIRKNRQRLSKSNNRENNNPTSLKKWADTRWDSRWSSINSIILNYKALIISLQELEDEGNERSVDARGLLLSVKAPIFVVSLFIVHKIFGIIKVLSDQLKAKSIDFCKAQCLIKSVIAQIADLRNEQAFSYMYLKVTSFCKEHDVDILSTPRAQRNRKLSIRFKDVFISTSIGQRDNVNNEDQYRTNLYYPLIDSILIELNDRFSFENMQILNGISALCPDSDNFLKIDVLKPFALQMKTDLHSLDNEIRVLEPMMKNSKSKTIVELYVELLPLAKAFPTVMFLIVTAMTIPVSSTTCERTFSKMKLIKTTTRNTMSDARLNDLCVIAVERDFKIDFEKLMDDFSDLHKNSRILLK
ncbi:unnamed protein product [Rotaria sp. Silwood2]|nr:unnamed protein product [Rotaria sp. Silwood2]